MIRHTQTIFGDGSDGSTPGNCFQTAVASLLDLPLDEVPHFVAAEDWWGTFCQWVMDNGLRLTMYEERFKTRYEYEGGWLVSAPLNQAPYGPILLASGPGPRGFRHSVLWQGTELAHDPHPSGDGLLGDPEDLWMLEARE